jgi:hypothetical protein
LSHQAFSETKSPKLPTNQNKIVEIKEQNKNIPNPNNPRVHAPTVFWAPSAPFDALAAAAATQ